MIKSLSDKQQVLFQQPESSHFERKAGFSEKDWKDSLSKTICAFANDVSNSQQPGLLILGLNNAGGSLSGQRFSDEQERALTELRTNGDIQPLPHMALNHLVFDTGDVLEIQVFPSTTPPVRYKGRVYVRVGSTTRLANPEEERSLFSRTAHGMPFDARPCYGASLQDLSLELFYAYRQKAIAPDIIEANGRSLEYQLAALRFWDVHQNQPTHAAILLFGTNPRFFLPGSYVQFAAFQGPDMETVEAQQEISGDLLSVIRTLEQLIIARNQASLLSLSAFAESSPYPYPPQALRELLVNALIHRSYEASHAPVRFYWFDDRLEIQSPGSLYGQVTSTNFNTVSDYRNPLLADAAKVYGYVNKFGYGIQRAQRLLQQNGNPPAVFNFEMQGAVTVTVYAADTTRHSQAAS